MPSPTPRSAGRRAVRPEAPAPEPRLAEAAAKRPPDPGAEHAAGPGAERPSRPGAERPSGSCAKRPFDYDEAFRLLRRMLADLPKAAMFALRDAGHGSPFEQLVASLLSARTRDEVTTPACLRLFAVARTPAAMAALEEERLAGLIREVTFPEPKARDILALSRRILAEHGGVVPDSMEGLTAFRGVGPKIAALTLGVAFGRPAIAVDVHVHRITNRWGIVSAATPERSMAALEAVLPRRYWIEINERLVPFGKFVCTGERPRCSACLLLGMCGQVGVARPR